MSRTFSLLFGDIRDSLPTDGCVCIELTRGLFHHLSVTFGERKNVRNIHEESEKEDGKAQLPVKKVIALTNDHVPDLPNSVFTNSSVCEKSNSSIIEGENLTEILDPDLYDVDDEEEDEKLKETEIHDSEKHEVECNKEADIAGGDDYPDDDGGDDDDSDNEGDDDDSDNEGDDDDSDEEGEGGDNDQEGEVDVSCCPGAGNVLLKAACAVPVVLDKTGVLDYITGYHSEEGDTDIVMGWVTTTDANGNIHKEFIEREAYDDFMQLQDRNIEGAMFSVQHIKKKYFDFIGHFVLDFVHAVMEITITDPRDNEEKKYLIDLCQEDEIIGIAILKINDTEAREINNGPYRDNRVGIDPNRFLNGVTLGNLFDVVQSYNGETYHVLKKNCQTLVEELVGVLVGQESSVSILHALRPTPKGVLLAEKIIQMAKFAGLNIMWASRYTYSFGKAIVRCFADESAHLLVKLGKFLQRIGLAGQGRIVVKKFLINLLKKMPIVGKLFTKSKIGEWFINVTAKSITWSLGIGTEAALGCLISILPAIGSLIIAAVGWIFWKKFTWEEFLCRIGMIVVDAAKGIAGVVIGKLIGVIFGLLNQLMYLIKTVLAQLSIPIPVFMTAYFVIAPFLFFVGDFVGCLIGNYLCNKLVEYGKGKLASYFAREKMNWYEFPVPQMKSENDGDCWSKLTNLFMFFT